MSTTLVDGLPSTCGESEGDCLLEFGHVDTFLLEIGVSPLLTCRVELGSTSPVGVSSPHL